MKQNQQYHYIFTTETYLQIIINELTFNIFSISGVIFGRSRCFSNVRIIIRIARCRITCMLPLQHFDFLFFPREHFREREKGQRH